MYNQINNDSSSASDESIQKKVVASAAMNHSNQMIMDQIMVHRPVNTIKAYSAKQKKWKVSIFALGWESILVYAKAISSMYNILKTLGWSANGSLVKTFLNTGKGER